MSLRSTAPGGHRSRGTRALFAAIIVAAILGAGGAVPPAYADAGVTVSSPLGGATADAEYATTLEVHGSAFQSIPGGFGGVYVLFGWVGDGWRPSQGGAVGADYRYVPDSESKDNQGFQQFVAFPGGETEAAAQTVMGADGGWSVSLVVPGAVFQTVDRDGNAVSVDCLQVQCGVLTIGAHGVKNANNETFTPVSFTAGAGGGGATAESAPSGSASAPVVAVGDLRIGFDPAVAVAGNAFAFTARGFAPGEQVVAALDRGAVAVGPLTAGAAGEVAGVLGLPADLAAGTHLLTVTGAATDGVAEAEITVAAAAGSVPEAAPAPAVPTWVYAVMFLAIALAAALLLVNLAVRVSRALRRRRASRRAVDASAAASVSGASPPGEAPLTATAPAAAQELPTGAPVGADDVTRPLQEVR